MYQRLMRRRGRLDREHALVRCALIAPLPPAWPGTVHVGSAGGHQPRGGPLELHAVELIYRDDPSAVVIGLSREIGESGGRVSAADLDPAVRPDPGLSTLFTETILHIEALGLTVLLCQTPSNFSCEPPPEAVFSRPRSPRCCGFLYRSPLVPLFCFLSAAALYWGCLSSSSATGSGGWSLRAGNLPHNGSARAGQNSRGRRRPCHGSVTPAGTAGPRSRRTGRTGAVPRRGSPRPGPRTR